MKKVVVVVLAILFSAGLVYAEHELTKGDLVRKARLGTGLEPSDSIATEAIKCGMDFIQSLAAFPVCLDTIRIDVSANKELYSLPADCYEPIAVYISPTGRCLDWCTLRDKQKLPDATTISSERFDKVFYFQDDSVKYIGFDPVPTAGDSVQLVYEANATEILFGSAVNSQRVRIRESYHPALVAAVKAYLWERYGREDKANRYLDKAAFLLNGAERKLELPPIDIMLAPKTETRN